MPRKQCRVRNLFVDVSNPGLKYKRVRCIYCDANIASNGTRMVSHLKKCKECTDATKNRYLGHVNTVPMLNFNDMKLLLNFIMSNKCALKIITSSCIPTLSW